jgi:hypothetical protein|tara:strand:- start:2291 stop:2662 length:372 start_codon:yes stop_codon:yes gene_type:complete
MSRVKHTYWHGLAKILILSGFKPAMCSRIIQDVFPETDINGRHIGAYKRRIVNQEDLILPDRPTMGKNEATKLAHQLVSAEDMFIYNCSVGSAKRTLECFQFKFIAEEEDEVKKVEQWITDIQ